MADSSHKSSIIAICAHVIVAPEDSNTHVFSKGTSKGLRACTPEGGHTLPTSMLGLKEEWKKAQKNAKKNSTSEVMNKIIPIRIPLSTFSVCFP